MMIIFGERTGHGALTPDQVGGILDRGIAQTDRIRGTPIARILDALGAVGALWAEGGPYFERAVRELPAEIPFSPPMIRETLRIVGPLLARDTLAQRLTAELGDPAILDDFVARPAFDGTVRAFPLGLLLHVSAGNVFLGCIDSLLMGFLTKNVSILKLSSRNQVFPSLFAESIFEADRAGVLRDTFAVVHWPGGAHAIEDRMKQRCNAIVAWGGEEMVKSYREGLPLGRRLIDFGPKISCQVIFRRALAETPLDEVGRRVARDIATWDQAACASPQNLFFEEGIDPRPLMEAIGRALAAHPIPRGALTPDEEVEILKEKFRGKVTSLTEGGAALAGDDFYLHYDPHPGLRPSALNRTLILKSFKDVPALRAQLAPYAYYLQSCGVLADGDDRRRLRDSLGAIGVARFAALGRVMEGLNGGPHDGGYCLAGLVRFVGDERGFDPVDFINDAIAHVPHYRQVRGGARVARVGEMPLLTSRELMESPIHASRAFLRDGALPGPSFIFSSGGTSSKPKFAFYRDEEFARAGACLGDGFLRAGLRQGDVAANLFVAGNLWSSFMIIERALARCGAVQLPIGGMADPAFVLEHLDIFKPRAVFGLPSLLVNLANQTRAAGRRLEIPYVFYAGEHLNQAARRTLREAWGVAYFRSAGYASVDGGLVGWQCAACEGGDHHLFAGLVHLEIVDGEGVITSSVRTAMPIIRYRTGDRVAWLDEERCPCGAPEPRFVLLGRVDGQINIWSCHITLEEIARGIDDACPGAPVYQITLDAVETGGGLREIMTVTFEGEARARADEVRGAIYHACKDLAATYPLAEAAKLIEIAWVPPDTIERIARTGKIRGVVDRRA